MSKGIIDQPPWDRDELLCYFTACLITALKYMRERALDLWSTAISKPGLTTFSSSQGSSSNTVTDRFFARYLALLREMSNRGGKSKKSLKLNYSISMRECRIVSKIVLYSNSASQSFSTFTYDTLKLERYRDFPVNRVDSV